MNKTSRPRVPQSNEELERQLQEQLEFLKRSCAHFDEGDETEHKRIAAALRILLYSGASQSLLQQLGLETIAFVDSAAVFYPDNLATHFGLGAIRRDRNGVRYIAVLDKGFMKERLVPFDYWWKYPVFLDVDRNYFTRGGIVRVVANQDGGAHVDSAIDEAYAKLSRKNALAWIVDGPGGEKPLGNPVPAALRQIAYEAIKSLEIREPILSSPS